MGKISDTIFLQLLVHIYLRIDHQ